MSRFAIEEAGWSDAQRGFAERLRGSARGKIGRPFLNLLPLPGLAERVADLGAWLRFEGGLPGDIRELVVLAVAEYCRSSYEWIGHAPLAREQGLSAAVVASLARGGTPDDLTQPQATALEAAREMLDSGRLGDENFAGLADCFGREGALEIVALCGYYSMLAMVIAAGYADADRPDWDAAVESVSGTAG